MRHKIISHMKILLIILVLLFCMNKNFMEAKNEGGVNMKLVSPEFENNKAIPAKFSCEGKGVNPPLSIENIPEGAKSLVLIVDDPDAPMGTFVHWVVYDIPIISKIGENSIPGKQGITTARTKDYVPPCPPFGTHRYLFKIYALDKELGLKEGVDKNTVLKAMEGHILGKTELIGLYKKGS